MASVFWYCQDCGMSFLTKVDECDKCSSTNIVMENDEALRGGFNETDFIEETDFNEVEND